MVWNQQLQMYHRPPIGQNICWAKGSPRSQALSDVERKVAYEVERESYKYFEILAVTTYFLIGNLAENKQSYTSDWQSSWKKVIYFLIGNLGETKLSYIALSVLGC